MHREVPARWSILRRSWLCLARRHFGRTGTLAARGSSLLLRRGPMAFDESAIAVAGFDRVGLNIVVVRGTERTVSQQGGGGANLPRCFERDGGRGDLPEEVWIDRGAKRRLGATHDTVIDRVAAHRPTLERGP
jgi:hypothetical protein